MTKIEWQIRQTCINNAFIEAVGAAISCGTLLEVKATVRAWDAILRTLECEHRTLGSAWAYTREQSHIAPLWARWVDACNACVDLGP